MLPPLAVNVLDAPAQITAGVAVAVTTGNGKVLTATFNMMDDETHPLPVTVTTTVWLPEDSPVIVNGLAEKGCAVPPSKVYVPGAPEPVPVKVIVAVPLKLPVQATVVTAEPVTSHCAIAFFEKSNITKMKNARIIRSLFIINL